MVLGPVSDLRSRRLVSTISPWSVEPAGAGLHGRPATTPTSSLPQHGFLTRTQTSSGGAFHGGGVRRLKAASHLWEVIVLSREFEELVRAVGGLWAVVAG